MIPVLINGLWQGAIIVALAAILTRYVARESATTRYAIWLLSLFAIVVVPVVTLFAPLHLPAFQHSISATTAARLRFTLVQANVLTENSSVVSWIVSLWACGAGFMLLRLSASALRLERIRRNATPVIVGSDVVLASDEVFMPIAAGVLAPVVILPGKLLTRLSSDDLARVIAHERAHIARRDVAVNYVQKIVEAILFFNPWVHAIANRLIDEREAACDDLAVAVTGESHDYAACLASLAQTIARRSAPLVSPSVFGTRRALIGRIERLVNDAPHRTLRLNYPALAASAAVFLAVTLALQLFSPAVASTTGSGGASGSSVANASCATPDAPAAVTNPAMPEFPPTVRPTRPALIRVDVSLSGVPTDATLVQSSGDTVANAAATEAAIHSTYKPATRNCKAVAGSYIFRVEFAPNT